VSTLYFLHSLLIALAHSTIAAASVAHLRVLIWPPVKLSCIIALNIVQSPFFLPALVRYVLLLSVAGVGTGGGRYFVCGYIVTYIFNMSIGLAHIFAIFQYFFADPYAT
jgi:hypothetical protein